MTETDIRSIKVSYHSFHTTLSAESDNHFADDTVLIISGGANVRE